MSVNVKTRLPLYLVCLKIELLKPFPLPGFKCIFHVFSCSV